MTQFNSYAQVGAKEEISDIITTLTPTKTPMQTLIGTEKIKQRLAEWQEDSLDSVRDNALAEGFTASNDTLSPTTMRSNNTQILSRTAEVSGSADSTDTYGRKGEMAYQMRKKSQEVKRDLEHALVGTAQTAVAGSTGVARKFAGVQAQINSGATITVDSDAGTGGNQAGPLTETIFNTANQTLYNLGAEATVFMVKPADSMRVANFASAAGRTRDFETGMKLVNVVNVIVTPFGEQKVVMNRFIRTQDALLLDPDMWKLLVFRPWFRETLAKVGDATRIMIVGEYSLKHMHRDATALITNLTA